MSDYFEEYKKDKIIFDETIERSLVVSNLIGNIQTSEKNNYLHRSYSKLLLTSLSLMRLCSFSRLNVKRKNMGFFLNCKSR